MSKTPRTEAALESWQGNPLSFNGDEFVKANFARQLERENARLRAALKPFAERGAEGYAFSSDVYETARAALKDANG